MSKRWYVIHAFSGFEKQVQRSLTERITRAGMEDMFGDVLVPTEEVVEMKGGQKRRSDRKFFPGYVLVEMEMNDETWHLVKEVPKVMGFIGGTSDKPAAISQKEADTILSRVQEGVDKPCRKYCLSQAKWYVLLTDLLMISMARLKRSIMRRVACV